ncbi:MAG: YhcB family protein [Halioglobus sp.]
MYSLNEVLVAGAILLFVSLGLGILIGRRMSPQGKKNRELETQLDQALQDKKSYEDDVVEHFSDTAVLLNKLTESYRDVHNQLAMGATTLCQGQGPVSLAKIGGEAAKTEIPGNLADIQPPLDYAPKSSPNETGMLNEEFGLERVKPEATETTTEAPGKP